MRWWDEYMKSGANSLSRSVNDLAFNLPTPKDIRKPDPEPIPFELLRSRTIHYRTATHDVYERYEPVGGMLILVSVERVAW
jgi:hypothetical protein